MTAGGRELNVSLWLTVRGGQWFLCVRRDGLDDATAVPLVMALEPLDPAAPHWYSDPFDFFGEGEQVRLFVTPS